MPLLSNFHDFKLKICCHSNECSLIGNVFFPSDCFQGIFPSFLLKKILIMMYLSMGLSFLRFTYHLVSISLCLSPNLESFQP